MAVAVRENWTDGRLDDFKQRVDQRFDVVDRRFDELNKRVDDGFARMDAKFDRIDEKFGRIDVRLDSMGRAIIFAAIAFPSSMIAGFVAIATQV